MKPGRIFCLILLGLAAAVTGVIFAEAFSALFNGLERNSCRILGMGAYLCILLVVCTGVILSGTGRHK